MAAPLDGIHVVDLSELLPGPFTTQILSDLGARVTKIERPSGGDNARVLLPDLFAMLNRGKTSLSLDLKVERDRCELHDLARGADVVVEGYRPGVAARLGVDYATLSALNPLLIYASISGYGQTGPLSARPGHDINYQAQAGTIAPSDAAQTENQGELPLADLASAMFAVTSILAALIQREKDGRGQYLDISMTDALVAFTAPRRGLQPEHATSQTHPAYGLFRTKDGQVLSLAAMEDHFFRKLVDLLPLKAFSGPAFERFADRVPHAGRINSAIRDVLLGEDLAVWTERLDTADIPISTLADPYRLDREPIFKERGLVLRQDGRQIVRYPVRMRHLPDPDRPVPEYKGRVTR